YLRRGGGQLHIPARAVALSVEPGDRDARPGRLPLLAAPDRGAVDLAAATVGPVGSVDARSRPPAARLGPHPAPVHTVARSAERLLRAGHVRQPQPRRAP